MTDDVTARLAEIEQRANAAAPGPWEVDPVAADARHVRADGPRDLAGVLIKVLVADILMAEQGDPEGQANAEFIAHAREDIPWLVAEVRRLSDSFTSATFIYFAASKALAKALGLDPEDADACVPGCTEGPAGLEHDIWHLTQQRDEAQARLRALTGGDPR